MAKLVSLRHCQLGLGRVANQRWVALESKRGKVPAMTKTYHDGGVTLSRWGREVRIRIFANVLQRQPSGSRDSLGQINSARNCWFRYSTE
jgi:hypothetical protein